MKKLIAMLLALVMVFSLVACGSKTETTESTETTVIEETEYNGELPLVKEGENNVVTIGIRTNPNVTDYNNNAYTLWLEEQTGVDIQFGNFAGTNKDAGTQVH